VAVYKSSRGEGAQFAAPTRVQIHYLLSLPPASVEDERAFSAAGTLCMRIRSRLGDDALYMKYEV